MFRKFIDKFFLLFYSKDTDRRYVFKLNMPWSNEHKTKQKMIQVSLDLFYELGYEKTSVEAIVKKAGVSKGAFFHHFKSKDDVLEAIAEKYSEQVASIMIKIADDPKMDAVTKFNKIITEGQRHKVLHSAEYRKVGMILYDHKNFTLHHKILHIMKSLTQPPIEKVITQGMKEGVFKVEYPAETAEAFMHTLFMMRESFMPILKGEVKVENFEEEILKKVRFTENLINRMLGAEPRMIKFPKLNKTLIKLMKLFIK
ncbi:MAG: TetR family transcriptional regulator [Calditrichae bacterium]|nr:TetR family transcriptional regulator [Calditrichia bacterium]NIW80024.1 TetR family transcriptional regulator [Calditrichia bacterium]